MSLSLYSLPQNSPLLDLEEMSQDFVLETTQITIPGYPHAFNPSIVRWRDMLLLSFRNIPDPLRPFGSQIGIVQLNEDFTLASEPQILDTQAEDPYVTPLIPPRSEDGRLVTIGDQLFLVYSDNKDFTISKGGFRVYIAEVDFAKGVFSLHNFKCLSKFAGETQLKREKNWTPFDYQGKMFLAYSLTPHRIFQPPVSEEECISFALTNNDIAWEWGDLRGGSPGLIVGNQYLSFFHSSISMETLHSNGKVSAHYFMGAYTFSLHPPFEITSISPHPIIGKNFYHGKMYKPYWGSVNVVFPCGFIFDDHYIWVSYGRQDHEIWISKLDKQGLLDSLIPVMSLEECNTKTQRHEDTKNGAIGAIDDMVYI